LRVHHLPTFVGTGPKSLRIGVLHLLSARWLEVFGDHPQDFSNISGRVHAFIRSRNLGDRDAYVRFSSSAGGCLRSSDGCRPVGFDAARVETRVLSAEIARLVGMIVITLRVRLTRCIQYPLPSLATLVAFKRPLGTIYIVSTRTSIALGTVTLGCTLAVVLVVPADKLAPVCKSVPVAVPVAVPVGSTHSRRRRPSQTNLPLR
jgi:hypothetical protein